MKKFAGAMGKALLYMLVYLGSQIMVTLIYSVVLFTRAFMDDLSLSQGDFGIIAQQVTERILEGSMAMLVISLGLTMAIYWIFFAARKKSFLKEIHAVRPAGDYLVWLMIPAGILWQFFVSGAMSFLPIPETMLEDYAYTFNLTMGGSALWQVIAVVVAAPICEEVVFRGLVFTRLKKGMATWVALILQALAFGLMHGQILWISYAFVTGIVIGLLFEAYDSLFAPLLFHFAVNASSYLLPLMPDFTGAEYVYFAVSAVLLLLLMLHILKGLKKSRREPAGPEALAEGAGEI
jgi:membrane protease YdiL (CAAX protease family)